MTLYIQPILYCSYVVVSLFIIFRFYQYKGKLIYEKLLSTLLHTIIPSTFISNKSPIFRHHFLCSDTKHSVCIKSYSLLESVYYMSISMPHICMLVENTLTLTCIVVKTITCIKLMQASSQFSSTSSTRLTGSTNEKVRSHLIPKVGAQWVFVPCLGHCQQNHSTVRQ
ncbi:hypothetical protein BDB01DRAFT_834880 [Pilobolus umbonatus]|nr:hypothetical protein BDB01DRAFT_834880 [Pilobolus umbonatus]